MVDFINITKRVGQHRFTISNINLMTFQGVLCFTKH